MRAGFIAISLLLTVLTLGKKSWLLSLAAVALTVNAAVAGLLIGGFGGDSDGFCWDSAVNGALWGAQIALMVIAVVSLGTAIAGFVKKKIAAAKAKKASAIANQALTLDPQTIRFSQNSVNTLQAQTIIDSMTANGWQGGPIDVVLMPDGGLTAIDNKRLLAAKITKTPVQANVHRFHAPIATARASSLVSKTGSLPTTWGEGALNRIARQTGGFATMNPFGSNWIRFGGTIWNF